MPRITRIAPLSGDHLTAALPALARLRIEVFRAWPYLYDGALDYESTYLAKFAASRDAVIVAASVHEKPETQGQIIGCATGSALDTNHAEFTAPLRDAGIDIASTFYCGESVLLPDHRGVGIGHRFFDEREAHARERGYRRTCFCAVIRPDDHPLKPEAYRPLDQFWTARGYAKVSGAIAHFPWKDLGEDTETLKPMQFWMREL